MVLSKAQIITIVLSKFPSLRASDVNLTSPSTPKYNCIAHAAGDQGRWWWPDASMQSYWPRGTSRSETIQSFQEAFETLGYIVTNSHRLEIGIEKIAIYATGGKPLHAARQLIDGSWTSKLGQFVDVSHPLYDIQGTAYGSVTLLMSRARI